MIEVRVYLINDAFVEGFLKKIGFYPLDFDRYGKVQVLDRIALVDGREIAVGDIRYIEFLE